ncbi:MAG: hypothetical protein SFU98_07350 [Leptospiraceae bacterium]|nr:hypothetical protein [Leptospiraceae bacterium]
MTEEDKLVQERIQEIKFLLKKISQSKGNLNHKIELYENENFAEIGIIIGDDSNE